jgi:hypothetical protein
MNEWVALDLVDKFSNVYSWDAWFKSLTLEQLVTMREAWYRAFARSKGFEHAVMSWDLACVTAEINTRRQAGKHPIPVVLPIGQGF